MLGATVLLQKVNFKSPSGVQVQLSLSASSTAAGAQSSSGSAHFICVVDARLDSHELQGRVCGQQGIIGPSPLLGCLLLRALSLPGL